MKLLKNTVTIYTVAFNGYWQKYGAAWTARIKNLDPVPTEVIVVCDEQIDTEFKLIIETDKCISSFRNAAIKSATSDWVVLCDIDDTPLTNFIDDLDYNFDIIAVPKEYITLSNGLQQPFDVDYMLFNTFLNKTINDILKI